MKSDCNNPFNSSYKIEVENIGFIEYEAKGECGMGGPEKGRLSLDGQQLCFWALPTFSTDKEKQRIAYFKINFDEPKVILTVYTKENQMRMTEELPFGAYTVEFMDEDRITTSDKFTHKKKIHAISQMKAEPGDRGNG